MYVLTIDNNKYTHTHAFQTNAIDNEYRDVNYDKITDKKKMTNTTNYTVWLLYNKGQYLRNGSEGDMEGKEWLISLI